MGKGTRRREEGWREREREREEGREQGEREITSELVTLIKDLKYRRSL